MHLRKLTTRSKLACAGVILAVATSIVAVADPALAAVALTVSPNTGPAGSSTGPTITVNTTTAVFSGTPAVQFQEVGVGTVPSPQVAATPTAASVACWGSYATPTAPTTATSPGAVVASNVVRYSATKLYVPVPNLPMIGGVATKYNVCVYSGTIAWTAVGTPGSALVASLSSGYTVSAAATVTSVSPASGPARGGTPIVVTGVNLLAATVTLGGIPMTPVIASDGLSFTATTPPHAADGQPVTLAVTTTGGTVNKTAAFMYSNGIIVTPNTAPRSAASTGQYVEIQGVGFSSLSPTGTAGGTTPDTSGAHVYLTQGRYSEALIAGHKTNPELSECSDVLVMNDGLLICKVNLVPYVRTVTDATVSGSAGTPTITSATAGFTQNDIGMTLTSTGTPTVGTGALITGVSSPTTATFTSTAPGDGLTTTLTVGNSRAVSVTTSGATLSAASGTGNFTNADIGRVVAGTGVFIAAIVNTDSVLLSDTPAIPITSAASKDITNVIADGAYTMTVVNDGRVNANALNPNYNPSVISSGATFTVGDYLH